MQGSPIKVIATLRRRAGLSLEEFEAHYFERHARLAAATIPPDVAAGITRYVQNHALRLGLNGTELPFDCIAEISFRDVEAMRRWVTWYQSPDGKVLRDDEERFLDLAARRVVVTIERIPDRPGLG